MQGAIVLNGTSMAQHNDLGKQGEELASRYLQQHGYTILERDWKQGQRDIDLIALDGDTIVFVEVKTRTDANYAEPEQAVDYRKMRNLAAAADSYVKLNDTPNPLRFDIISIVGATTSKQVVHHFKDAFNPLLLCR